MQTFKYRAKNGPRNVEGIVDAQSKEEAIEKLHELGYVPVRVEGEVKKIRSKSEGGRLFLHRVRSKDITIFSRQLASMIRAGVSILPAFAIISRQSENLYFRGILNNIQNDIKNGKALSLSLADYPKIFSPLYIAMIRSGETSGNLEEVLLRIADHRQKQDEIMSRVRSALAYPILMAAVGTATVVFMLTFVMPRLMRIFLRLGQELPWPTKLLISISTGLQYGWPLIIVFLGVIIFIIRRGARNKAQKTMLGRLKLALPLAGNFIHKNELAGFCRTLELLIRSGIPILKAINVTVPTLHNEIIKAELLTTYKDLEQGGSLGKSLQKSKLFPEFMTSLIIIGEQTGKLDEALAEIASSYERDTDEAVRMMVALLEPLMILIMGLIVGFIVMAMLLPVFQINIMDS